MDPTTLIVSGMGAALLFLIGAVWQIVNNRLDAQGESIVDVRDGLAAYKTEVATNYAANSAVERMEARLLEEFRKIEATQQRIFEELKSKADK
jgi:hypothetical protein